MLSLTHQIGSHPFRVIHIVCNDKDLARPRDHINADNTVKLSLGFCDPCIAGTGYDVDAANPVVFCGATSVGLHGTELPAAIDANTAAMKTLEEVRSIAAERLGMTPAALSRALYRHGSPWPALEAAVARAQRVKRAER